MAPKPNDVHLPESVPNPSFALRVDDYAGNANGGLTHENGMKLRVPMERRWVPLAKIFSCHPQRGSRYYAKTTGVSWPPEVRDYNRRFTKILDSIKKRHDPTVTTVAQGVLEWKRSQKARNIGLDIQAWLDRFYMSRIGIRFLIGQRESLYIPIFALFVEFI